MKDVEDAPEDAGLSAIVVGIRMNCKDDFEAIEKGTVRVRRIIHIFKIKAPPRKNKTEIEKMDRKQQYRFIKNKTRENL